jgi:16S rRNA G966 N2-methylase RsmD
MLELSWHPYKYYPYEHELALREVQRLLCPKSVLSLPSGVAVEAPFTATNISRLVYFASQQDRARGGEPSLTQQALLEQVNARGRQSTRYSAHGLHEYKGKFNPQVAKALLNIFGVRAGNIVLDPFCGSGTSLVEAAHLGIRAIGMDMNPLAVFLANTKLQALTVPAAALLEAIDGVLTRANKTKRLRPLGDERTEYLQSWFSADELHDIERLRDAVLAAPPGARDILLAIGSNLLRDYSLQEPSDLRIRRRTSPMPEAPLLTAFESAARSFAKKLAESQAVLGLLEVDADVLLGDSRHALTALTHRVPEKFDAALTSPPYATALPYIDTQRLSLVWLDLLKPGQILELEAQLVGSREVRGESKSTLLEALTLNTAGLPEAEANLCTLLQSQLTERDGFRRQAVPRLLYRYFAGMAASFSTVLAHMKSGAMYGLIIGGNHTVLSGQRFDIDTPAHLASLAVARGWSHIETVPLQTYKRFGLHAKNASTTEALVLLRA